MNFRYLKIWMIALALVFATQGCAVFVRDHDHHHRYRHHRDWRSSVEQTTQSMAQLTEQNGEDSGYERR